ncbi:hypothetical protein VCHA53O464_10669 [Vibrio chagasii]|nr:hypothetical protein VCHA53O464_10669 [Vibrio chagasii]
MTNSVSIHGDKLKLNRMTSEYQTEGYKKRFKPQLVKSCQNSI